MGIIRELKDFRNSLTELRKIGMLNEQFKSFTVYAPSFSSFSGGLYEMDLTRAAIHSIANNASKAHPIILGETKYRRFEKVLQNSPNGLMTSQQFLYRLFTILKAENTCFIIPLYEARDYGKITGLWPVRSKDSKIVRVDGKDFLRYKIRAGTAAEREEVIELERVGIMRNHYYSDDYYGDSNSAMNPTMELINVQNQGIIEGVKQSATIRFMMKLATVITDSKKLKEERDRIRDMNLSYENNGGLFLYDNKYSDAKQVESKPFIVDADQSSHIRTNVYNYFGVNEKILQNSYNEDEWNAFYEGQIEPLLIQLSQVVTKMLFTENDIENGYAVLFESSRLQYASNSTKLSVVTQLFDRGFITHNQGLAVFNLAPVPNGDTYFIRREYVEVDKLSDKAMDDPIKIEEGKDDNTEEQGV